SSAFFSASVSQAAPSNASRAAASASFFAFSVGAGTGRSFRVSSFTSAILSAHPHELGFQSLPRLVEMPRNGLFGTTQERGSLGVSHVLAVHEQNRIPLLGGKRTHGLP